MQENMLFGADIGQAEGNRFASIEVPGFRQSAVTQSNQSFQPIDRANNWLSHGENPTSRPLK